MNALNLLADATFANDTLALLLLKEVAAVLDWLARPCCPLLARLPRVDELLVRLEDALVASLRTRDVEGGGRRIFMPPAPRPSVSYC